MEPSLKCSPVPLKWLPEPLPPLPASKVLHKETVDLVTSKAPLLWPATSKCTHLLHAHLVESFPEWAGQSLTVIALQLCAWGFVAERKLTEQRVHFVEFFAGVRSLAAGFLAVGYA